MNRIIDRNDILEELKARTGYYKYQLQDVLDALEDVIYTNMQMAALDEPSEIRMFHGFVIGAKRIPEKITRDPRNQELINTPEHLNPYTRFKQTFKKKVNRFECEGEELDDEYMAENE